MKGPVFIVKPKNIFRHPFNKFDLDKPLNRDTQNEDLTDYFNYGFNEDTMNIYGKLVKRTIEVLDQGINPTYFDAASELMRLNDQIPMDFGGFCKFFDTSIFACPEGTEEEFDLMNNYYNGERLFNFFIYIATSKNQNASQYPLIDFVRCMYKNFLPEEVEMCDVMDQVEQNLQKKYQQMMKKLNDKKNNPGGGSSNNTQANQTHDKKTAQNEGDIVKALNQTTKKQQDKQAKEESSSSQSSDSQSDDSSSDSDRRRKKNKNRSGRSKSRSRSNRKDKKNKNKTRKVSKDRKDRRKDKHKDKSKKKSRSRDRSRRKDKSKKRRS